MTLTEWVIACVLYSLPMILAAGLSYLEFKHERKGYDKVFISFMGFIMMWVTFLVFTVELI